MTQNVRSGQGKPLRNGLIVMGAHFFLEWKWQATVAAAESRRPLSMKIMILLPGLVASANWHRQTGSDQADTDPGNDRTFITNTRNCASSPTSS
ncbi:MAG: hypothetical protein NTV57_12720 [Cyanobacteria bacterium]|nr:hypothetical protein [Cyanobacteriota bacterium]